MEKVYIVSYDLFNEDYDLVGVFSSKERAKEEVQRQIKLIKTQIKAAGDYKEEKFIIDESDETMTQVYTTDGLYSINIYNLEYIIDNEINNISIY